MNIAILDETGTIKIPDKILKKYTNIKKFIIIENEDDILLRPIRKMDILSKAEKIKDNEEMSMEEISEEVHTFRKKINDKSNP